jgi:Uma2 family endonuclease
VLTPFEDRFDIMTELSVSLLGGSRVTDICLYLKLNYDWEDDEIKMIEPPITKIEILSPTQSLSDLIVKIREQYFQSGVKSTWIIIPPLKTVLIFYPIKPIEIVA